MAASSLEVGRYLRLLMMTIYVASPLVLNSELSPSKLWTWPEQMLSADPVMKAEMAGRGIKSTIKPKRAKPKKQTIAPHMMAMAEAIT